MNKLQDTATELDPKDTFLRTCKSLLNRNWNLNLIDSFFSVIPQSNSEKVELFQVVNMVNHSDLTSLKSLT